MTDWLRAVPILALLLAAPAVAVGPSPPIHPVNRDMDQAAATVDSFHAALRRGDTLSALFLIADDALIFEDGRAERKAEYAARHLAADSAFSKAVAREMIERRGDATPDGLAWIATQSRARGRYRGTRVDQVGVETMVLRRVGGTWQIVNIHWSSAPSSVE